MGCRNEGQGMNTASAILAVGMLIGPSCAGFHLPASSSPWQKAASSFTIAYVSYQHADDAAGKDAARALMATAAADAAGLLAPGSSLDDVVPQPGLVVLLAECLPEASGAEIALYAKVVTLLLTPGSGPNQGPVE